LLISDVSLDMSVHTHQGHFKNPKSTFINRQSSINSEMVAGRKLDSLATSLGFQGLLRASLARFGSLLVIGEHALDAGICKA
jgi:hypothetical protein